MRTNRYEILGYGVWHGAKWYVRRRLPSTRVLALAGVGALVSLAGAVALARRMNGS